METLPLRLMPGQDLRGALVAAVRGRGCGAAFVLSGLGSLSDAHLRFAAAETPRRLTGALEILSLSGTIASNGSHLHMALADATGAVFGGRVATGYDELVVRPTVKATDS